MDVCHPALILSASGGMGDIFCQSDWIIVWLSVILFGVNGVTIVAVGIVATLTRKIHLNCFKDTKQVNGFVFSTIVCLCFWLPYTLVFTNFVFLPEAAYIFNVIPYFVISFLCEVFLFVPKVWSARHERYRRRTKHIRSSTHVMHFDISNCVKWQSFSQLPSCRLRLSISTIIAIPLKWTFMGSCTLIATMSCQDFKCVSVCLCELRKWGGTRPVHDHNCKLTQWALKLTQLGVTAAWHKCSSCTTLVLVWLAFEILIHFLVLLI